MECSTRVGTHGTFVRWKAGRKGFILLLHEELASTTSYSRSINRVPSLCHSVVLAFSKRRSRSIESLSPHFMHALTRLGCARPLSARLHSVLVRATAWCNMAWLTEFGEEKSRRGGEGEMHESSGDLDGRAGLQWSFQPSSEGDSTRRLAR